MVTDYVVFVHGVNTRENAYDSNYADRLFANIQAQITSSASSLQLKKVPLYWGDVTKDEEAQLKQTYERSPTWPQFWFRNVRETLLLQFIGDAALYISRYVGAKIVEKLKDQLLGALGAHQPDDRLHLVTHSLGTIILFDVLFSSRWDPPEAPGHDSVEQIRNVVYGIQPNALQGIHSASIHTMGSPLGLYSLMNVDQSEQNRPFATHDITPRLQQFLRSLAQERGGRALPWWNFAHPGDPLAYPLVPLLYELLAIEQRYLAIQDQITHPMGLLDAVLGLINQSPIALLDTFTAHNSYWESQEVAIVIARTIRESAQPPSPAGRV